MAPRRSVWLRVKEAKRCVPLWSARSRFGVRFVNRRAGNNARSNSRPGYLALTELLHSCNPKAGRNV